MNIFEESFEEITTRVPEKIFTDITQDFSTAAQGLAELNLIEVDNQIATELKIPEGVSSEFDGCFILKCDTEEEFIEKLHDIFNIDTFKKTVGGVMKIAKERQL